MANSLYYKDADGTYKQLELGGAGDGVSVQKIVSSSRSSVLTAGTAFAVPQYVMGENRLLVHLDGLLCSAGAENQYIEDTTTSIKFNDDIATDIEISVIVLS